MLIALWSWKQSSYFDQGKEEVAGGYSIEEKWKIAGPQLWLQGGGVENPNIGIGRPRGKTVNKLKELAETSSVLLPIEIIS